MKLNVDVASLTAPELAALKDELLADVAKAGGFNADDVDSVELVQNGEVVGASRHARTVGGPATVIVIFKDTAAVDADAVATSINEAIEARLILGMISIGGKFITADVTEATFSGRSLDTSMAAIESSGANLVERAFGCGCVYTLLILVIAVISL